MRARGPRRSRMWKPARCSMCRRILRVALFLFAFLAPPTFAGVVTLYARTRSVNALEPLAAEPAAMPPRPPAGQRHVLPPRALPRRSGGGALARPDRPDPGAGVSLAAAADRRGDRRGCERVR